MTQRPVMASSPVGQHPDDEAREILGRMRELLHDTDEAIARHWDTHQSLRDDKRRGLVMARIDRLLEIREMTAKWLASPSHRKK